MSFETGGFSGWRGGGEVSCRRNKMRGNKELGEGVFFGERYVHLEEVSGSEGPSRLAVGGVGFQSVERF